MGWKGRLFEIPVWVSNKFAPTQELPQDQTRSIFVLRNNDIGDLLVITPLFDALRRRFPTARITAGVGDWNREVLENNPHVTDVLPVNAPWNNKFIKSQRISDQIGYVRHSGEVKALREQQFEVGIDILGSHVGALLLMQAHIPYRMGVRGYRGGHSAMQQNVLFRENQHVGQAALSFAELLGATDLPECRPQLFLTHTEADAGEVQWKQRVDGKPRRIVIGPGGGLAEKCWPLDSYIALVRRLSASGAAQLIIVGGKQDFDTGEQLSAELKGFNNLAGQLTLRETFAVVNAADVVITNPSMLMHVAAAFSLPTVVLLGEMFPSAINHDVAWGYPGTCHSLGREESHGVATVEEAYAAVHNALEQTRRKTSIGV